MKQPLKGNQSLPSPPSSSLTTGTGKDSNPSDREQQEKEKEKERRKLPTAEELVAHYESKGLETKEASAKVIEDLQKALFRAVSSSGGPRGNTKETTSNSKMAAELSRKLDVINIRLINLDRKMDSKPGYGETLAIGLASGVALRGIFPHVVGALGSIWNSVCAAINTTINKMLNSSGRKHAIRRPSFIPNRLWWVTNMPPHIRKPKLGLNQLIHVKAKAKKGNNLCCREYDYSGHEELSSSSSSRVAMRESLLPEAAQDGGVERVPRGFLAVYVGPELRRYVIPASYLSMPDFTGLLERAAEEFDYQNQGGEGGGGLEIPCEEDDFEHILTRCSAVHRASRHRQQQQ